MIVKNLDNKQSFLFSQLVARVRRKRRKRCYRGARNCGSEVHIQKGLYLLCSPISDCHAARRYIYIFFLLVDGQSTRVTDFARKKKALLLSWVEFCGSSIVFFSLQSTRAASLPTTDGLSFSSKRKAGSSRHFKWEVHMHIYTRFLWHWIDRLSIKCLCILDCFGLKYHTHSAMENLYQPLIRLWAVLPFCLSSSRILKKSAKKS